MKAFRAKVSGFRDDTIVVAASGPKATYALWSGLRDIGHSVGFGDIRMIRAPEYDRVIWATPAPCCIGEDYAQALIATEERCKEGKTDE